MVAEMRMRFGPRFVETARARVRRSLELLGKPSEIRALITELHSLAGEASMLGLDRLSETARSGEKHAKEWEKGTSTAPLHCARQARALSQQIEEFAASIGLGAVSESRASGEPARSSEPGAAAAPVSPPPAAGGLARRQRVLVIDDSQLAGEHLCEALADLGADARLAMTREAGLAAMTEFAPVMVVCDVHMPGVDLAEFCTALRASATRAAHIVLISGMSEPELARRAREVGAEGYVSKHAGIDRVTDMLRAALEELPP